MQRFALAGLLPVILALPSYAGSSPEPSGARPVVTEAAFLATLDEAHPAVVERMAALEVARSRVAAAQTLENPRFEAMREDPSGPIEQTTLVLAWQLPGADRKPRIAAREAAAEAEAARLEQQRLALRLELREIYADWAVAAARHDRLGRQAQRVTALAERERLRADRGEASGLEARRLELAASGLRTRVALAIAAAGEARSRAAGWLPDLPRDARPTLPQLAVDPQLARAHPLLRAAEKELAVATLERQVAKRFIASPEVSLGWQQQEAEGERVDGPILGFGWTVPAFDRKRPEQAAAEARVSAAQARLEQVQRELTAALAGAQTRYRDLATALAAARAELDGTTRMLDGTEAAFRLGESSLTDLLDTHRAVTDSELALIELHAAALAAHRDLERAAGGAVGSSSSDNLESENSKRSRIELPQTDPQENSP
ncbi:MAG: TolC family protein [Acidobacteriota bacterium]